MPSRRFGARILIGRGLERLAPLMSQGAEGFDEMRGRAQAYADAVAGDENQMLAQADATNRLSLDLKTLAVDGFGFIEPVIRGVTNAIDFFVQGIDRAIGATTAFLAMADSAMGYAERALGLPDMSNQPGAPGNAAGTQPVGTEKANSRGAGAGAADMAGWLAQHGYSPTAAAAIMGNAEVESSLNPAATNASGHFGLFQWDKARQQPLGGSTDMAAQMALMDAELQKLDAGFKTSGESADALTLKFEKIFERSGGALLPQRVRAAQGFLPETTKASERGASQTYQEQSVEYRHSLTDQSRAAFEHWETIKKLAGEGSAAEIAAKRELTGKLAQYYDDDTRSMVAALKQQEAAAADSAEKIRLQKQVIATIEARGNAPLGGGVDQHQLAAAQAELATLSRESASEQFRLADQRAEHEVQVNNKILASFKATMAEMAAAGKITIQESLKLDIAEAKNLGGQSAAAFAAPAALAATPSEQLRVADQLDQIKEQSATTIAELQKQWTEAGQKAVDDFAKPFKSAFDQIGSGLEKTVTDLLLHKGTTANIFRDLYQKAVSGAVDFAGSTLSKIGGGLLGGKPGEGVGDVLGNMVSGGVGKLFGIGSTPADSGQAANTTALTSNTTALTMLTTSLGAKALPAGLPGSTGTGAAIPYTGGLAASASDAATAQQALSTQSLAIQSSQVTQLFMHTSLLGGILSATSAMAGGAGGSALGTIGSIAGILGGIGSFAGMFASGGLLGGAFAAGGLFGSQGALFGTAADASIAAGGAPLALARGGIVPAAAGGWSLPSSFGTDRVLSALTPGETVLPVGERPSMIGNMMRDAIGSLAGGAAGGSQGGGDAHFHFHGPADAPSIDRWFKGMISRNPGAISGLLRSNALTPRTI